MPHIGKIIKSFIEESKLTYAEVGAKINRSKKTVPSYFNQSSLEIDLLIAFSAALKVDLLKFYYEEEPMKSLRHDEVTKLNSKIQRLEKEHRHLEEKHELAQQLIEALRKALMLKDIIEQFAPRDVYTPSFNEDSHPIAKDDKKQDDPDA